MSLNGKSPRIFFLSPFQPWSNVLKHLLSEQLWRFTSFAVGIEFPVHINHLCGKMWWNVFFAHSLLSKYFAEIIVRKRKVLQASYIHSLNVLQYSIFNSIVFFTVIWLSPTENYPMNKVISTNIPVFYFIFIVYRVKRTFYG